MAKKTVTQEVAFQIGAFLAPIVSCTFKTAPVVGKRYTLQEMKVLVKSGVGVTMPDNALSTLAKALGIVYAGTVTAALVTQLEDANKALELRVAELEGQLVSPTAKVYDVKTGVLLNGRG